VVDPCQLGTVFSSPSLDSYDYLTYVLGEEALIAAMPTVTWSPDSCATGITYTLTDDHGAGLISLDSSESTIKIFAMEGGDATQYTQITIRATLDNYYKHTSNFEAIKILNVVGNTMGLMLRNRAPEFTVNEMQVDM
jgi:hypothetical protein